VNQSAVPHRTAPTLPHLGDVLDFMRAIWALDHALNKTSKHMKASVGVTGPQRLVIRIVSRFPGITAGQTAELLHVHPSTLTRILKLLERQGLLRRRPDPRDRRRTVLGLTENGRRVETAAAGTVEAAVQRVLSETPQPHLDRTREVLDRLTRALSAEGYASGGRA
jgi:MarR family transcriptional regulator, organic hydroperoxide resistance regulator